MWMIYILAIKMNDYKNKSDDDLVSDAWQTTKGRTASVEMMRRLKDSINNLDRSNEKYSYTITVFTAVLIIIGMLQLLVTIAEPDGLWKVVWLLIVSIFLFLLFKLVNKSQK